jgi:hypothetical protein
VRTPDPAETGAGQDADLSSATTDPGVAEPQAGTPDRFIGSVTSSSPGAGLPLTDGQPDTYGRSVTYGDALGAGTGTAKKRSRGPLAAAVSVLVVILLVVGAVVIFGGSESASAKVVSAVDSTLNNGTAHLTMTLSGSSAGTNVTGSGSGSIDFTNDALQLQMTVGADGQQVPISAIYLGGVIYESIPGLSTVAPGKSWLSIDLSSIQKLEAQSPTTQGLSSNPALNLQLLAQQGNTVVPLGPSTIDGVAVNGYSVTVNTSKVAQKLKNANLPSWMQQAVTGLKVQNLDMKVFIDNSGMLRSLETQLKEKTAAAGSVSFDETLDFSDYGTPVSVTAPPAGQVESFQQLLQAAGNQAVPTS